VGFACLFHCELSKLSPEFAIEAPALGTPNIFINIKGLAKQFLGKSLADAKITRMIETPEEYVQTINTFKHLDRDEVSNRGSYYIKKGFSGECVEAFTENSGS